MQLLHLYQVVEYTLVVEQDHKHNLLKMQEFQVEVEQEDQMVVLQEMVLLIQVVADQVVGPVVMEMVVQAWL